MSKNSMPIVVRGELKINISVAWAKAFLAAINPRIDIIPLVVMVTDFDRGEVVEDPFIREMLDVALKDNRKQSCHTVANTIFPKSLWNPCRSRKLLYQRYEDIFPRLQRIDSKNNLGLYFERLIAYDSDFSKGNQLEKIISIYNQRKGFRRSVLQTSIFDPKRDHTRKPYLKFPCLQHVTFAPCGNGGLSVNGFYAMQYLFERAYGNYLGLCRLGQFVAHELGLKLVQMNCTIGIAELDCKTVDVNKLVKGLEKRLQEIEG